MKDDENYGMRIIMAISVLMFSILIGYNAFFSKTASELTVSPSNSVPSVENSMKSEIKPDIKLINLNTASENELKELNGVGDAVSKRIIEYRETHGGFSKIEEIMNVKGIGEKVFMNIKNNICV